MKKLLVPFLILICCKVSIATITINGFLVRPSHILVISYWDKYSYISDTIKANKKQFFEKNYNFDEPTHIWINSMSYAFIMPGDTLSLTVKGDIIQLNGSAATFILFRRDLKQKLLKLNTNYNDLTKYALEESEKFFLRFKHKQLASIKNLNAMELILSIKFSSLLLTYNNNERKMDSIANFIRMRQKDSTYRGNSGLLSFLDQLDLKSDLLSFHESLNTMNNLIRILRFNAVVADQDLGNIDPYLIERKIIISVLENNAFRTSLLHYNLYERIQKSENVSVLLMTNAYINDLKNEDDPSQLLPLISMYQKKLSIFSNNR